MRSARETLELLRDILRLYRNFVRGLVEIEREDDSNFSELENVLGGSDSAVFFTSLMGLDSKIQLGFVSAMGKFVPLSKDFQNALALGTSEKMSFVEKLDAILADLEGAIGISRIASRPADLDKQLVERCTHKDYHDTVTNAFALLEDKMRSKLGIGREYSGEELIPLTFNPEKGRLTLGATSAERQGIYLLFRGAFSFLRNPPSHTLSVDEGRNAALKVAYMVDLLIKLVDKADLRD